MNDKHKVLFISEKWCDANPNMGLTNNYHNLFATFKNAYPNNDFNVLHFDEYALTNMKHVDNIIPKVCEKLKPDYVIFSLLGNSHLNPSKESYEQFKKINSKLIFIWPDVSNNWGIPQITGELKPFADLHVSFGCESNLEEENLLELWAPQDEKLYYPTDEQDINVSFLGSINNQERQLYLFYLLNAGVNVIIKGGQRAEKLTPETYASFIRKSKISLNFPSNANGFDQCKGRVWEILASKSLLMERKNKATRGMLGEAGHCYIDYENEADLKNKVEYYLSHEEERKKIAEEGYKWYLRRYSSKQFWKEVFIKVDNE